MLTLEQKDHNSEEQSALQVIKLLRQLSQHSLSLCKFTYVHAHVCAQTHTFKYVDY